MIRRIISLVVCVQMALAPVAWGVGARDRDAARGREISQAPPDQDSGEEEPIVKPAIGLDEPIDPDRYIVGPGDEFVLILKGQPKPRAVMVVLPEGTVLLPNAGAIDVAGLTISRLRERLREVLEPFYPSVEIDCQLVRPRTFVAYVLGEVTRPGAVTLAPPFRVSAAIALAGGTTSRGSVRFVEVRGPGAERRTVDLFAFLRLGDRQADPALREGQTVYVPIKQTAVTVSGEVRRGGIFELKLGETVADAIRLAGGLSVYADSSRVLLEHYDAVGNVVVSPAAADDWTKIRLRNLDFVVVPDKRSFGPTRCVEVVGGGGREGQISIRDGETLGQFVPRVLRFRTEHDATKAVLERHDGSGAPEVIRVDLPSAASGGRAGQIVLRPGDVISIPPVADAVYVTGEVRDPGEFDYQRGLAVERYVAMAGGPTDSGSVENIEIYRVDGTKGGGDRNTIIHRGDTILVKRKRSKILGTIFVNLTGLTSLILSIYAVSRSK